MPLFFDYKDLKRLQDKKKVKRVSPVKPPARAEQMVRRRTVQLWKQSVLPFVERLKAEIALGSSLSTLTDMINREMKNIDYFWNPAVENIVDMWRLAMDDSTRLQFNKSLSRSLGIDISAVLDTPEVSDALSFGSMEMAGLIKSIPKDMLNQVARAVQDNFRGIPMSGDRSLQDQIRHIGNVSQKRAKLIARDQTAKMTSLVNQTRQQMLGVSLYVWRTSKDEKVVGRPGGLYPIGSKLHKNHHIMEGKTCKWEDPTVYSTDKGKTWKQRTGDMPKNHPGMDIQCRCYSEPVIDLNKLREYALAA